MATVKRCDIQQAQVKCELDQTINSADPLRADSLLRLQRVRSAKTKNQERERSRLTGKLGGEHPRVTALQAKIDTNYEVARYLNLESVRARTEVPTVASDDWLVHGRVMNEQREFVPGMKTALYDRSGCPVQTCGSEITDKTGYFMLTVKNAANGARASAEIKKNIVDDAGATKASDRKTVADTGDKATADKNFEVYLYVLDRNDAIVYRDKRPMTIAAGQVQYLEVVLDDGDVDHPPQAETRYLGNSSTMELHDLSNQQPACQIDEIRTEHRVSFKTEKEALALNYDYCAYCFGKDKSKR